MRIIILGAPGAGKGTQAAMLAEKLLIPHISTGDIFRSNIKRGTELGKKAKEYIDLGQLVPDEVTTGIVKDRILQPDCKTGFILDGFPRTIPQAEYLEKTLQALEIELDAVLNIHVEDNRITERMSGRRICPTCSMSYHLKYNPPQRMGECDNCHVPLIQREDDKEDTVMSRLKVYHEQTEPLVEFYRKNGKLVTVEGQEKVEDTTGEVLKALGVAQ